MREITPALTPELKRHTRGMPVWRAKAYPIGSYRKLVEHVARLAYINRDELLFFRGQDKDYHSKSGGSTLYPAIYRQDSVSLQELQRRFELLEEASQKLTNRFSQRNIDGASELRRKKYIQWSVLQHYEVLSTPLLDLSQSLRVACSFAQMSSTDPRCYVYVLGLPYITNRISINSEHDLVNVRLLSICPPQALRPYFQEGFLAGTADTTTDFTSKTELDFRNRLIAKFDIPRRKTFWGAGFEQIPRDALYPTGDLIFQLCQELKNEIVGNIAPGVLGDFLMKWSAWEEFLLSKARQVTERNVSVREAINALQSNNILSETESKRLHVIRLVRNSAVHKPDSLEAQTLRKALEMLNKLNSRLEKFKGSRSETSRIE